MSFVGVSKWIDDVRSERGNDVVLVLVANKCDLAEKRVISFEEGDAKAKECETLFIEVSAKSGLNIHNLFQMIAGYLPGNEMNNKFLTTDHNQTANNINLMDKTGQLEDDMNSKKKCQC